MDNTVPTAGQRPVQQPAAQPTEPQVSASSDVPKLDLDIKNQQISSPNKEFGPMRTSSSPSEQGGQVNDDEEEVKVSGQEVMHGTKVSPGKEVPVSQELKEAGVEQGADTEKEIPLIVQQAGMRATSSDDLIPISAIPTAKMPITYAHAVQLDKHTKIKESIKWLARFIKRQWEKVKAAEITQTE